MAQSAVAQVGSDPALLIRLAWANRWQSRGLSSEYAERAKTLLQAGDDEKTRTRRALADVTLSWQAKWRGEFDKALAFALSAEQELPEAHYPVERAELYSIMGVIHYSRHRLDLADDAVQRRLKLVTQDFGKDAYVDLLTTCATVHMHSGDQKAAGKVLGKARKLSSGAMRARVEHNVARWMRMDAAPRPALTHAEASIALAIKHGNTVIRPYAHVVAGACLVEMNEFDRAEVHFTKGMVLASRDDDARAQCQIIGWFAQLESRRGSHDRARDLYCFGREIAQRMNYSLWEKTFARRLADVYERLGELAKSVECHKLAWILEEEKRHRC